MGWGKKKKGSEGRWRDVVEMELKRMGRKGGKGGELPSLENGNDTRFREIEVEWRSMSSGFHFRVESVRLFGG